MLPVLRCAAVGETRVPDIEDQTTDEFRLNRRGARSTFAKHSADDPTQQDSLSEAWVKWRLKPRIWELR